MKLIIFFAGIVIGVLVSEVIRRVRTGKGSKSDNLVVTFSHFCIGFSDASVVAY